MTVYEAILKRRTIRKFKQEEIPVEELRRLVNAARVAPQGANIQPLKYVIVNEKKLLGQIFDNVAWAAYITPAGDPKEGERPVAYIIILADTEIKKVGFDVDAGAAVENILLASVEENIGTCWMGAINRANIKEILHIPDKYTIHTLIALGYAAEEPQMEVADGSIQYYKDDQGVLHVPKRKLEDVLFINKEIK